MTRDDIFANQEAGTGSFEFNEAVADVFPDMLRRSIPGYAQTIEAIGLLTRRHAQPGSRCYDLGCSLGAATLAMRHNLRVDGCHIIAVDKAAAMAARCRAIVAADDAPTPVEVREEDIRNTKIGDASLVVMNYTLQFLPRGERGALLERIAAGMRKDGVLVLSEKVVDTDTDFDELLIDLHHDFKRRNHYSDMEIARKRAAIENVLVPDSVATHLERLRTAGFRRAGVWLRWFNFVSILAVR